MKKILLIATVLLIVVHCLPANAAYQFYVSVEGTKQGKLKGEAPQDKHKDELVGLAYNYEVMSPTSVGRGGTGLPTGKRQHSPITITKEWGASSPQLFQALVTNEVLKSVVMNFYHVDPNGQDVLFYTVKLTNAYVSKIRSYVDFNSVSDFTGMNELEEVSFTFQKIEITNAEAKTSAMDDVR